MINRVGLLRWYPFTCASTHPNGSLLRAQFQRYSRKRRADEGVLLEAIEALACQHRRYGYRMVHGLLVEEGFTVGRDRVYRLRREHGYKMPGKQVKKRRLGISENGIMRQKAESINDVWCWDFIHDRDERGRVLRWLMIEDEFTPGGAKDWRWRRVGRSRRQTCWMCFAN